MKNLIVLISVILSTSSFAEVWRGQGQLFDKQRTAIASYQLKVTNTKLSQGKLQSDILVTLENGRQITDQCLIQESSQKWSSECENSQGGGYCFGDGLCQSYQEDANGVAFATTIIKDGAKKMRMLRTELHKGEAVRFYRETLHKVR